MSQQHTLGGAGGDLPIQRTQKGLKYEAWLDAARGELLGMTEEQRKRAKKKNLDFIRGIGCEVHGEDYRKELLIRAVTPAAVHTDSMLATMSVMYANDEYIGERLMPPVPVAKRSDVYTVYPKRERLAFPDDAMSSRGIPNEVEASRSTDNFSVKDYGYLNFVDLETLQNQDAPLDEMVDLLEAILEGIAFRREKRILAIVGASGNYAGNTAAATTDWTPANSGGSVIADINAARDSIWRGKSPTSLIAFCPLSVWNTGIVNNTALAEKMKYVKEGLPNPTQVAGWFGLDDLLVSRVREDTANDGQTASYARMLTGEVFGILAVANRPSTRSLHFGTTFRSNGDPVTTQWTDPKVGKRGGIYAKVAVSEDHKVVAGDAGFLITSMLT